jgi:nucleoside-diphosphate-sugar epimerase
VSRAESFWSGKLALVTGGASFIRSTLTDELVARGARVRIVDDLSSGHCWAGSRPPNRQFGWTPALGSFLLLPVNHLDSNEAVCQRACWRFS